MIHIGISGPIASGKSTLAKALDKKAYEEGLSAEIVSFATGIRELIAFESYGNRKQQLTQRLFDWGYPYTKSQMVASMIDNAMHEYPSKPGLKNRRLLQIIGSEIGRDTLGHNAWIQRVQQIARSYETLDFLISDDLRFDNEVMAVDVHVAIALVTGDHVTEYHNRRATLDPSYVFDNHQSERSLTLPALFSIPFNFTPQDIDILYWQLEAVRKLRI